MKTTKLKNSISYEKYAFMLLSSTVEINEVEVVYIRSF